MKHVEENDFNKEYSELQDKYYNCMNSADDFRKQQNVELGQMYLLWDEILRVYIAKYIKEHGLAGYDVDAAAIRGCDWLLGLYMKHPDFKIERISAYAHFAMQKALYENFEDDTVSLTDVVENYKSREGE